MTGSLRSPPAPSARAVVLFPWHNLRHERRDACHEGRCQMCEGGLSLCITCGGAEGSLPTHCPQRRMRDDEETLVYGGVLDFYNGQWVPGWFTRENNRRRYCGPPIPHTVEREAVRDLRPRDEGEGPIEPGPSAA